MTPFPTEAIARLEALQIEYEGRARWSRHNQETGIQPVKAKRLADDAQLVADAIRLLLSELAEARGALEVCRQTITEQAAARVDADMPLLTPAVLEQLRSDSEANYACAETREERVAAHGLSLLCDWQDRARALNGGSHEQG